MTSSPFSWPVRVYWEDTDGGGVVYYANYLKFLERARTEWLRALGYSQTALAVDPGILFMVANLQLDYLKPARLDDALVVTCEPERDGRVSMLIRQRILRQSAQPELLLQAEVRVACLDAKTLRPRRIPEFVALPERAPSAVDKSAAAHKEVKMDATLGKTSGAAP